jgi:hypothetical protein
MAHSNNESNLRFLNALNKADKDSDNYIMIDVHLTHQIDNRQYKIVRGKGATHMSDWMTCHETELFITGMIAQQNFGVWRS